MEEAEDDGASGGPGERGVDFEVCERVSPRARACTPLMAPSGYSRRTLSYLLFSAGCPEEAGGKGKESAGKRGRKNADKGVGRRRFIRKHRTRRGAQNSVEYGFREWKLRKINTDAIGVSYGR